MGGAEPFRCFNTGVRPTIHHVRTEEELWVVGPQLRAEEVRDLLKRAYLMHALFAASAEDKKNIKRRVFKEKGDPSGRRTVYAYHTRSSAVAKFVELCNAMHEANEEERRAYNQAVEDSKSDDPERRMRGALRLSDY